MLAVVKYIDAIGDAKIDDVLDDYVDFTNFNVIYI